MTSQRVSSIEGWRGIAIFAVICIHTEPFRGVYPGHDGYPMLWDIISLWSRFAVAFFFCAAGFFFSKRLTAGTAFDLWSRYAKRLGLIYLVWSAIYLTAPAAQDVHTVGLVRAVAWSISSAIRLAQEKPITFLLQGTSSHLWFLPGLLIALSIIALMVKGGVTQWIIPAAISLYLAGLIFGAYAGMFNIDASFNTRNGPFLSLLCVAMGWRFAQRQAETNLGRSWTVLVLGLVILTVEFRLLAHEGITHFGSYFLAGDVIYGYGVFLLALARPTWWDGTLVVKLGGLTLGVYASHFLFIQAFAPFRHWSHTVAWEIGFPMAIYLCAVMLTAVMLRFPRLRLFVS